MFDILPQVRWLLASSPQRYADAKAQKAQEAREQR
ncbi:MAG: hypothetical protein ACJARS_004721 [bacterium]